jgi:D-inositol-3-phosphate glycosyltransferase
MRVLFVHPSGSLHNPVLTVFAQVARHLDRDRFEAHIAVDLDAEGTLPLGEAEVNVTRWRIAGAGRPGSAAQAATAMAALARYVRRTGIDVVHCEGTASGGGTGLVISRLSRTRLLLHLHEVLGRYPGGERQRSPMRQRVERATARRADHVVAVSEFIAADVGAAGIVRAPIDVVPNGVDLDRFTPGRDGAGMRREYGIGEDEPLALQLGRVVGHKRHRDFIEALALARREVPGLRGLVVGWDDPGSPPSADDLRQKCAELGLGDAVVVADGRPEAPELMAAADVLVSPGVDESSGLVALEAMASGKPVIGARSGGTIEIVVDGETGFLVEPKAPAALAEKLAMLASDRELRIRMGTAGRRRTEREFDDRMPATRFGPIYEKLARS